MQQLLRQRRICFRQIVKRSNATAENILNKLLTGTCRITLLSEQSLAPYFGSFCSALLLGFERLPIRLAQCYWRQSLEPSLALSQSELCGRLGDEIDQAAW